MNPFKSLDSLFPTGKNRSSGEVVGIELNILLNGVLIDTLYWKRKAWYVNASVNAFHMHRGLVREFCDLRVPGLSDLHLRAVKRKVAEAIAYSYVRNHTTGAQGNIFSLYIEDDSNLTPAEMPSLMSHSPMYEEGDEVLREVSSRCELLHREVETLVSTAKFSALWLTHGFKWDLFPS
jgi:hypothetical protein